MGYRYTETRYEDAVLGAGNAGSYHYADVVAYPFGYGMSYTSFDISDMQVTKQGSGTETAKFLVNRRTYEELCGRGVDKSMLIISDIPKDGDCVMVKETPGIHETALSVTPEMKKPEAKKGWEPIEKKRSFRATKKKYRYKKRKK